ncbi:MAG: iron-containing alcohol dehydrogenase [Planctomycetota bacterium]
MFLFRTSERILAGRGAIRELGREAARLGSRALLVTGRRSLAAGGKLDSILVGLNEAGVETSVFREISGEPDVVDVDRAREAAKRIRAEVILAAGGGSVMDLGKATGALAGEEEPTRVFHAGKTTERTGLPVIACPTTSGSGAEVTPNAVLGDKETRMKKSLRVEGLLPRVAIVDPELAASGPREVTASAGMDAFTQAVESFLSIKGSPMTRALSREAAKLIAGNLARVVEDGSDLEAREAMSWGSLLAGIALANARLGAVHGIAHPLGALYGLPHGVVCAALLPHVLEINRAARDPYRELARALGEDPAELARKLLEKVGLAADLKGLGVKREDWGRIVEESLPSGSLAANPVPFDAAKVMQVLDAVS